MLTTGAGAHGVTRRWRVAGAWAVPGRMTSEGLSGLTGLFEKYRHEKSSGMRSRIFKHAGAETNECHKSSLR